MCGCGVFCSLKSSPGGFYVVFHGPRQGGYNRTRFVADSLHRFKLERGGGGEPGLNNVYPKLFQLTGYFNLFLDIK